MVTKNIPLLNNRHFKVLVISKVLYLYFTTYYLNPKLVLKINEYGIAQKFTSEDQLYLVVIYTSTF